MKRVNLILLALVASFSSICLSSCSDDDDNKELDDPCGLQKDADAYVTAAQTYGQNPTVANCQAFRQAALKFVNAADDCTLLDEEAEAALEEARQELEDLDCTASNAE